MGKTIRSKVTTRPWFPGTVSEAQFVPSATFIPNFEFKVITCPGFYNSSLKLQNDQYEIEATSLLFKFS